MGGETLSKAVKKLHKSWSILSRNKWNVFVSFKTGFRLLKNKYDCQSLKRNPKTPFDRVSHDKILHDCLSILAALTSHFELKRSRPFGPGCQSRTACGYYTFCHACERGCEPFMPYKAVDYVYARDRWSYHHSHQNQHQLNPFLEKCINIL